MLPYRVADDIIGSDMMKSLQSFKKKVRIDPYLSLISHGRLNINSELTSSSAPCVYSRLYLNLILNWVTHQGSISIRSAAPLEFVTDISKPRTDNFQDHLLFGSAGSRIYVQSFKQAMEGGESPRK